MPIEKRYKTLRVISTFLTVLAWIFLVGGVVIGAFLGIDRFSYDVLLGIVYILAGILSGGLMFAMFKTYAELLHIAIDLEENTRRTAALLERK